MELQEGKLLFEGRQTELEASSDLISKIPKTECQIADDRSEEGELRTASR
jgi:hypothetical protein